MGTPEDTALHGLRVSAGQILDNFGFTQISDDSMEVLSDIMRRFIKKMAMGGKLYAEHAGRSSLNSDDLYCAFKRMKFSTSELYHFFNQNSFPGSNKTLPKFPAPRIHSRPLFHPQPSEKELENRPEHIPQFLQAAHPEWTRDGADYLAVMKPSTSVDKKGAAPDFPSFMDFGAKDLGISKEDRKPVPRPMIRTDESSATGITSSANLSSQKLNNHYDHPSAPPMFKRKTKNGPFNGLKDSRSSTPIGRSNSPYNIFDRIDVKTETLVKEEKPKLKPRPSIKMEPRHQSPAPPPVVDDGSSSPMPTLELIGGYTKDEVHDLPETPKSESDYNDRSSPPRVADAALAANIILFQQLKAQEERDALKRSEKEKENEQKQKKKEESQRKKEEKQREKERIKREKEEKRRRDEEARMEKERRTREKQQKEKERREREEQERKEKERKERDRKEKERQMEKAEAERKMILEAAAPRQPEDLKSLKIVISNPKSNHASSAFSPPSGRASSLLDNSSTSSAGANGEDDADTIPFVEGSAVDTKAPMEFPLNISVSTNDSPSPSKKKHKKKDKERDRSSSPHKKHKKKDKEHKKKKKRERERDEDEHRERKKEKKEKRREEEKAQEKPEQKITLKIRLGDQTPSQGEITTSTPSYGHESVKLTFKNITPDRSDERVPPLRIGVTPKEGKTPERPRLVTKAELKAPASSQSHHSTEKEEKQKRREEKKRREREEAERKQKEQLEMFERQHEEKKRREAEEKNRRDEEQRRIAEADEKRRRKEREQKEKEEKERLEKEKERLEREKEVARKEKEKEKREKEKRESLPAPVVAHVTTDPSQKKKHKKEKRQEKERQERERQERERECESERERARERECAEREREQREREREQVRQREAEEEERRRQQPNNNEPEEEEQEERVWICPACSVAWAEGANMVACDMCDDWFHWACVGLLEQPVEERWYCRRCSRKRLKRPGGSGGPGGSGSGGPPSKKRKRGEGHGYLKT